MIFLNNIHNKMQQKVEQSLKGEPTTSTHTQREVKSTAEKLSMEENNMATLSTKNGHESTPQEITQSLLTTSPPL